MLRRKPVARQFDTLPPEVFDTVATQLALGPVRGVHTMVVEGDRVVLLGEKSETSRKFVLETATGRYFLKEIPWYCDDPASIAFSAALGDHLADCGLPVPRAVRRPDDRPYLELSGSRFVLFEYRPGRLFDGSAAARREAGRCLGRMHTAMRGFRPDQSPAHESVRAVVEQHLRLAASVCPEQAGPGTPLADLVGRVCGELSDDTGDQPVHGDFIPWNLAHGPTGAVCAVYDLDNACGGSPLRDLGKALSSYHLLPYQGCTTVLPPLGNPPEASALPDMRPLLDAYQRERPLTGPQRDALPSHVLGGFVASVLLSVVRKEQTRTAPDAFGRWFDLVTAVATDLSHGS
jgi:Ser/Thr protein kinase RdoA (MazF antagonist)